MCSLLAVGVSLTAHSAFRSADIHSSIEHREGGKGDKSG